MNKTVKKKLLKAVEALEKKPERFAMELYLGKGDNFIFDISGAKYKPPVDCGTVCCLAGQLVLNEGLPEKHDFKMRSLPPAVKKSVIASRLKINTRWLKEEGYVVIERPKTDDTTIEEVATAMVGEEAAQLFQTNFWPKKYRNAYKKAARPATRVRVLRRVVEEYIAKH